MAEPFTPVFRDGKSAASLIVELVQGKPYGHVLTYQEIADALGIEPAEMQRIYGAMQRAKPRLERDCLRAIEAHPGVGYVILRPGQNVQLATKYKKKSDKQIKRAISVIAGADERDMTPAERERNRQTGMALKLLHDRQLETEGRVARLESLLLGNGPKVIPGTAEPVTRAIESGAPAD